MKLQIHILLALSCQIHDIYSSSVEAGLSLGPKVTIRAADALALNCTCVSAAVMFNTWDGDTLVSLCEIWLGI